MGSFKSSFDHHLLFVIARGPLHASASASPTGILHSLPFSKISSFLSSHSRFYSNSSSKRSLLMELVKTVVSKGSAMPQSIAVDGLRGNRYLEGTRIGIVAEPCAEFVAGILGTWLSGGVAVPLALSYPEAELLQVMNDSDVSMILSTEDHQELMKNVANKTAAQLSLIPPVLSISESTELDQLHDAEKDVQSGMLGTDDHIKIKDEDPALILYTSGTTGKPK